MMYGGSPLVPTVRYQLSQNSRVFIIECVGLDLMRCLDRIGSMSNYAIEGDRHARRGIRRLRIWLGPKYWTVICLMVYEGKTTSNSPRIRSGDCRDALVLAAELETLMPKWGMR